jgi:hypothetical protein
MVGRVVIAFLCGAQLTLCLPEMQHRSLAFRPSDNGTETLPFSKTSRAGGHPSLSGVSQTKLAANIFDYISNPPADNPLSSRSIQDKQFVCRSGSIQTSCPALVAKSDQTRLDEQLAELAVPADARWFFEGPSYMFEIFFALAAANGGCVGQDKFIAGNANFCYLSNGALLVSSNDQVMTTAAIGLERWTHAFFMMPHGHEYDAEHAAAAKEGRAPDPAKMRDALGRDMCLPNNLGAACCDPGGDCCATPDPDAGFADYVDCLNTLTSYARFKSQLRSTNIRITVVVPWHLPRPSNASNRPYLFTHERVVSFDCMTVVHTTGKSTDTGFAVLGISSPAVNRKNIDGSTLVSGHQCIAACDDEACHLGSVVWVARDLVQRALRD